MKVHRNDLSKNSLGALSELRACADLVDKGWNVYRAVTPDNEADLVISKGSVMKRIEVRTGSYSQATGALQYPRRPVDAQRSDHYAIVASTEKGFDIHYIPELEPEGIGKIVPVPV